jgi:hypothetical protein
LIVFQDIHFSQKYFNNHQFSIKNLIKILPQTCSKVRQQSYQPKHETD